MVEPSSSAAEATFQDYLSTSSLCWHQKMEFIIAYGADLETEARPTNSLSNSEATPIWGLGSAAAVIMGEGASPPALTSALGGQGLVRLPERKRRCQMGS